MISREDFYKKQIEATFSDIPWLSKLQKDAFKVFDTIGFPQRDNEDWKYTSVDPFFKQDFVASKSVTHPDKHALEVIATSRQADAPLGIKIPLINGFATGLSNISLPKGVIVTTIDEAFDKYPKQLKAYLDKILTLNNGMQALNTAMLNAGLFIYVERNTHVEDPLLLSHINTEDKQATYMRHLIVVEEGSSIDIIEDYQGNNANVYFTNAITELQLDKKSTVNHYKIQREGRDAFHYGYVVARQYADSKFESHLLNIGGKWSRSDTSIDLQEAGANCLLNGIYMPNGDQHMDQQTTVNHTSPNCFSEQDYRGIVTDKAKAIFNGKIYVSQGAKLTSAKQQNKNLLLSNQAEVYTKPQLNIYADDVICTHGATVGQLDEESLFYFATRGIDNLTAKMYLLRAFASDNLKKISKDSLAEWMSSLLEQQMR